ncbi:MAG: Flp pilus assembly protein CpaB, partial [Moorellales bacterium]
VIAFAAAISVYWYLQGLKQTYRESGHFRSVVVAAQRIPPRTRITAEMVAVKDLPARYLDANTVTELEAVVGKVSRTEILPGEILRRERLAGEEDLAEGLALQVPSGLRAVTVAVNEVSGLAGLLRPGDKVDVLSTFERRDTAGGQGLPVTALIVQNVKVLSVDQALDSSEEAAKGKKQIPYRNVTLLVSPAQAQYLTLGSEKGSIRLLLRSPSDEEVITLPVLGMNQLAP